MSDESNLQPQLLTEVSDAYYRAIGRVTVEFSHLESRLLSGCAVLLETPTADQAFIVISQLPFPRLLSSFCSLFAQKFGPGKQVAAMLKTF